MRKIVAISVLLVLIITSCNKTSSHTERNDVKRLKTGSPINIYNEGLVQRYDVGFCNCNGHGGSAGGVLQWILATCKSNCQRGIGFRCGRQGILRCQDGTTVICVWGANCPKVYDDPERLMEAEYEIYDNQTIKLTFLNEIPEEERNSSTGDVFEVEETDYVAFSSPVSVDDVIYQGFDILEGNYYIDYSDGVHGSVVVGIQFK
ncbi:MAG: hypothetical protein KDB99_04195 [Chitinophagaceae bacterium]|nr:hypothetical protein [Chitinophagaceae bacterium]